MTLAHAAGSQTLARYDYSLDAVGNRVAVTETLVAPPDSSAPALPDSVTATFTYDGDGNRVAQTINGESVNLALDRTGLPEVIATSTGDTYLHLPGLIVQQQAGRGMEYLLADGLGSVRQVVDGEGLVVAVNEYDPYGVPLQGGGSPYGYTGEWWQGEISLLYLRARWYDAGTGRFLTRDPWLGNPLWPQTLNGWSYALGNSVKYVDSAGTTPLDPILEGLRQKAEDCFEAGDLQCVWRQYWWLSVGGASLNYSHAAANLHHFLYKLGDVEFGPYSETSAWVRSSPAVQDKKRLLEEEIPYSVRDQAKLGEVSGPVRTSIRSVMADRQAEQDLYYAMFRFQLWAEADYEITQNPGCNYEVTIWPAYHFADDYNWHEGLVAGGALPGVAGFEDEWAAALHDAGLAKEFKIHGYWKEGAKVYTYPSNWLYLDPLPPPTSIRPGTR